MIISHDFLTSADLPDAGWRWSTSAVHADEQDADHDHSGEDEVRRIRGETAGPTHPHRGEGCPRQADHPDRGEHQQPERLLPPAEPPSRPTSNPPHQPPQPAVPA